jgi:uncharacterized protein YbjT (DUF2867 family)
MYAIVGATGNIGHGIVERLLIEGERVRAIGRDPVKLRSLGQERLDVFAGNIEDPEFTARAFEGARAVFAMIPPSYGVPNMRGYQNDVGRSIAEAVSRCGIKHVVSLSSVGAHLDSGTGPILGLRDQEERLNRLEGVNVLHLRPTFFMENLMNAIPVIESRRVLQMALRRDLKFAAIATRDIAAVAAERLRRLDFNGKVVQTLLGERDVTMAEFTKVLGRAIGQEKLPYVQVSYETASRAMMEMGCSADVARGMIEMLRSMNEGKVIAGTARTPETKTPTSIERFALEFAEAYAATRPAKAA